MRIYPEQLAKQLQNNRLTCYLIFGDEVLLSIEALELIKQQAKQHGFLETFSYSLDGNFDFREANH